MRRWLCALQVCFDTLTLTMMYVLALFECASVSLGGVFSGGWV